MFVYFFLILNLQRIYLKWGILLDGTVQQFEVFFRKQASLKKRYESIRVAWIYEFLFSFFPFLSSFFVWSRTLIFDRWFYQNSTRRFFAWIHSTGGEDISVMKCKSQEMERKYQATVINYSGFPPRCSQNHTAIQIRYLL